MKTLLVLVSVLLFCTAEVDKDFVTKFVQKMKKVVDECMVETKASQDDVNTLLAHKIPETHEGKCLIFCFQRHFHMQSDDGSINKEGALASLEPIKEHNAEVYEKIVTVFETCADTAEKDSDPCLYATNLVGCAVKEGKSMGLDELLVID